MNFFDAGILHLINGFAARCATLDSLVIFLNSDGFQKGGVVMILFWWAWFMPGEQIQERRQQLVCTMLISPFALAASRLISFLVPFRVRPLYVPELHLRLASGLDPQTLINWNSFPSDHAVLFFCFATGLAFVSRKIGAIAFVYVSVFIAMPRIFLGLHYPTDILAGALLGMGAARVAAFQWNTLRIGAPALRWMETTPEAFYAAMFVCSYQVANAFGWARDVVVFAEHTARVLLFRA
jgi:undecaprenyl-diphosphatase